MEEPPWTTCSSWGPMRPQFQSLGCPVPTAPGAFQSWCCPVTPHTSTVNSPRKDKTFPSLSSQLFQRGGGGESLDASHFNVPRAYRWIPKLDQQTPAGSGVLARLVTLMKC